MREVTAKDPNEFWDTPADAYVVTTNLVVKPNGENIMGGGIARQVAERFPWVPLQYGMALRQFDTFGPDKLIGKREHVIVLDMDPFIVCMPTKRDVRDPSPVDLVVKSAAQLVQVADATGWKRIHLPQPGCGLGGLNWNELKPVLEFLWDDRFVVWGM